MATIATYGAQKESTQVVREPRASNVPAGAFGGAVGQGLGNLGKGVAEMGQRIATTEAEEALIKFEREKNKLFFDPESGYFNTQGRDAYDTAADANKSLLKLQEQHAGQLRSDTARQMFTKAASVHLRRGEQDIMQHAAKGMRAWEVATVEAQVENSLENAALYWNDSEQFAVQRALGRQAVMDAAKLQGIDGEALNERLQTFESSYAKTAITAATVKSAGQGKQLMDKWGDRLEGPDKIQMQAKIDAKAKTERNQYLSQQAVVSAGGIVNRSDSRADIIAEVNKIGDVELRDKTMREAMWQYGMRKQAESEDRAAAYEAAEGAIGGGQSPEQFQAQDPEAWDKLSPKQQRTLQSGEPVATDWNTFSDLMTLPKEELAKIDPTEYYDRLGTAQRKSLISAVKTANNKSSSSEKVDAQVGRSRTAQTKSIVEQIYGPQPTPSKAESRKEYAKNTNAFYALLDSEVEYREQEKGGKLSSDEYTALLGDMTRKVVQERAWYQSDLELDMTDVPAEYIEILSQDLRDNGVPVTSDNLIKAYNMARK